MSLIVLQNSIVLAGWGVAVTSALNFVLSVHRGNGMLDQIVRPL